MPDNPFATILSERLTAPVHTQDSLRVLQEFCEGVELSTGHKVKCQLERGRVVNDGQEWRPVIRSSQEGTSQLLLRAYVPLDGWPVKLDLYDGPLVECVKRAELTKALKRFLSDANVVEQIRYMMAQPPAKSATP